MKKLALVVMSVCLLLLAACSQGGGGSAGKTVTDMLGNEVAVSQPHTRIVSLSPAATEIIYALGAEELLLADSTYCDYPAAAQDKPKVGDFSNPNVELILSYEPDLILISAGEQGDTLQQFQDLGITVFCMDAHTVAGVLANIEAAGQLTGHETEAQAVVAAMQERLDTVAAQAAAQSSKPTVFVEIWDDPLMTAGGASFISDMIAAAGGVNIAADLEQEYPEYAKEQLLAADPAVYIINGHAQAAAAVGERAGYQALQAVQNQRVYEVDENLLNRCGPRVVDGVEALYHCFYGE